MNRFVAPLIAISMGVLAACTPTPPVSQPTRAAPMDSSLPAMRTFGAPVRMPLTRSNMSIAQDFLDLAFKMESGRSLPIFTRFEGPITVRVAGHYNDQLVTDLLKLTRRMQTEAGVNIFVNNAPNAAITVEAVPRSELNRVVPGAACFVVPRVSGWQEFLAMRRTPAVDWATVTTREKATVFVPSDVSPQETRDCLHEELAQAIGPLNDLYRLSDSIFNDDNMHAVLTSFDMLVLRAFYSPELRSGMSRQQVAEVLPGLLARLNPAGERGTASRTSSTSRDWIDLMEYALSSSNGLAQRQQVSERAINLTRAFGWNDIREGFANFVYGRLNVTNNPQAAYAAFLAADQAYRADPGARVQRAHVAVQLAAYTLSHGRDQETLAIANEAIPIATAYENASLLATLMMFKAEALENLGYRNEAQQVRLDSLGWARYGFGSEQNIRTRLQEVERLDPS